MHNEFTPDDDKGVLESIVEHAKQLRRKRGPESAATAAKVELMFSKAIAEISAKVPESATEDPK